MQIRNLLHQYDLSSNAIVDIITKVKKITKKWHNERCKIIHKNEERIKLKNTIYNKNI